MEKPKAGTEVLVYAGDHSPWAQAVVFKLTERGYRDSDEKRKAAMQN